MWVMLGYFECGMDVIYICIGCKLWFLQVYILFVQDCEKVEEVYFGDIVGFVNFGVFQIGDVVSVDGKVMLLSFLCFMFEMFVIIVLKDVGKCKVFMKGLIQFVEEGVVQVFYFIDGVCDFYFGVVGLL